MSPLREPVTITQLKRELRGFATKKDLRRFATKKDLRRYATKRDMRLMAAEIRRHFDVIAEDLRENLQKVAEAVAGIPAVNDRLAHHDRILDDHETRITAVERRF